MVKILTRAFIIHRDLELFAHDAFSGNRISCDKRGAKSQHTRSDISERGKESVRTESDSSDCLQKVEFAFYIRAWASSRSRFPFRVFLFPGLRN